MDVTLWQWNGEVIKTLGFIVFIWQHVPFILLVWAGLTGRTRTKEGQVEGQP